jgi:hypothetical protein
MNAVSRGNSGAGAVLDGGGGVVPESARVPLWELMRSAAPFDTIGQPPDLTVPAGRGSRTSRGGADVPDSPGVIAGQVGQ